MTNPNKTVAEWRRKNPRPTTDKSHRMDQTLKSIMDAVSEGKITAAEGAEMVRNWQKTQ